MAELGLDNNHSLTQFVFCVICLLLHPDLGHLLDQHRRLSNKYAQSTFCFCYLIPDFTKKSNNKKKKKKNKKKTHTKNNKQTKQACKQFQRF